MRGMAEMTLIKLGEAVDKPQARRIKMVERALEEQKAAVERRKREAEQGEAAAKERSPEASASPRSVLSRTLSFGWRLPRLLHLSALVNL